MSQETESPARVLVVDDDLHTRELLRELCESHGHTVAIASDGNAALAQVVIFKPDLVLLDVMIPGIDGFGVLQRLRGADETKNIPVIILTAASDLEGKIRGIELGADDYVTKPFRIIELSTRMRAALTLRQYREKLQAAEAELESLRTGHRGSPTGGYPQLRTGIAYELARARRYGRPLAALVLCIENFDVLRGQLGRSQLDGFAREVTNRLRDGLRETDRLFRIDLDEFVAVLPETDAAGAEITRERVLAALATHPAGLVVSAGIGMVTNLDGATPEEVMRSAKRDLEGRPKP